MSYWSIMTVLWKQDTVNLKVSLFFKAVELMLRYRAELLTGVTILLKPFLFEHFKFFVDDLFFLLSHELSHLCIHHANLFSYLFFLSSETVLEHVLLIIVNLFSFLENGFNCFLLQTQGVLELFLDLNWHETGFWVYWRLVLHLCVDFTHNFGS